MIFIIYAQMKSHTIGASLGLPDYSYYFVLKQFKPLLKKYGPVFEVSNVRPHVDRIYGIAKSLGQPCVFLSFTPPHKTAQDLACPTIPVFAWEYSTIPDESWGGDERNNWVEALKTFPAAITHSQYAREVVMQAVGADYPIVSIPAPVWDPFEKEYDPRARSYFAEPVEIRTHGWVIDSADLGDAPASGDVAEGDYTVKLTGVVYTSVFNPDDGRKNWPALLQAFCWAFKDVPDATLVLKLTHADPVVCLETVASELYKLMPFRCRVLAILGYLSDAQYNQLIRASSYVVNSAFGEGQCLPLMEFMSAGRPAIAPDHSAMADYIKPDNSFIVNSSLDWTTWPHDPRVLLRTFRYRIDWGALHDAYLASYDEAKHQPEKYRQRSARARSDLQGHCSRKVASQRLQEVIKVCAQRCENAFPAGRRREAGWLNALFWRVAGRMGIAVFLVAKKAGSVVAPKMAALFLRLDRRLSGMPIVPGILRRVARRLKVHATPNEGSQ